MTDSQRTAIAHYAKVELAKRGLLNFALATDSRYTANWHHELLCTYLDRFVAGEIKRLMIFMPPRHGKSELVSRKLPAYIFGRYPDTSIIATSYTADLAGRMNRDVQRIIDGDSYRLIFPKTVLAQNRDYVRNNDMFEIVGHRGVYRAAGVGGGITGMGGNFLIVDDPHKSREEANSAAIRDRVYEWYTSTLYSRLEEINDMGGILLTCTRWHEDDLAGRLLRLADTDPLADRWHVLNLPAIAEGALHPDDPRADGEALWPSVRPFDRHKGQHWKLRLGGTVPAKAVADGRRHVQNRLVAVLARIAVKLD